MNVALREPWTVERFLAWENRQEGRHEFDGARIVEVTGCSRNHQRIVSNLIRLLEDALDPDLFDAVPEMRLELQGKVRYPDVAVVAGRLPGAARTLRDAVVLFEVTSEDSAVIDRGDKRAEYAGVPGVRQYVVLEQTATAAVVFIRTAQGWTERHAGTELPLPALGITLPLAAVYRGVRFD